jgi:hypothetical protein
MKMKISILVAALLVMVGAAFSPLFSADGKKAEGNKNPATPATKPTTEKVAEKPLVIPDPLPTDPAENAKLAKAIIEKARNSRISIITKAKRKIVDSIVKKTTWIKYNPDGTSFMRIETKSEKLPLKVFLNGVDGNAWRIVGDIAIKEGFRAEEEREVYEEAMKQGKLDLSYKVEETLYKGLHCYKITASDIVTESLAQNDICKDVYIIDKKYLFIYSEAAYSKNGKKLYDINRDEIKILEEVDESIFKVPDNCKMFTANNIDQLSAMMRIALNKENIKLAPSLTKYYQSQYGTSDIYKILALIEGGETTENKKK